MKVIETERLVLTLFRIEDAEGLYSYASHPEVGPPAGWKPHENIEESREIIKNIFLPSNVYAIRWKGEDYDSRRDPLEYQLIGTIGLEPDRFRPDARSKEIGYSLGRDYWGRGIMTEAAAAIMEYAFLELDMEILCICCSRENLKSQRVIEKAGFSYEGTIRMAYKIYDGSLRDSMEFSITKEEWLKLKANK